MILTGKKIVQKIKSGGIVIKPFKKALVNPNSYNYRLGSELICFEDEVLDIKKGLHSTLIKIPKEGYLLEPNKLYLASTLERIGSNEYVPSLIGRSSLGRLGLFLQITADLGHIGTEHCWTLELKVVQPLRIYKGMKIGQLSFWLPEGIELLNGSSYAEQEMSYANYSSPQISILEKIMTKEKEITNS